MLGQRVSQMEANKRIVLQFPFFSMEVLRIIVVKLKAEIDFVVYVMYQHLHHSESEVSVRNQNSILNSA